MKTGLCVLFFFFSPSLTLPPTRIVGHTFDPLSLSTAWGLMRWWNFPFPAFFSLLWMMSGSCQARWLRVASDIWMGGWMGGGVPRELC